MNGFTTWCLCGNTVKYLTQTSTCYKPCSGDSSEICGDGSYDYYSVYSICNLKVFFLKISMSFIDIHDLILIIKVNFIN